tara:strand:+ start:326 stop:1459 length:1134 start_codon:yes stop_codon:yes gene_type:complete
MSTDRFIKLYDQLEIQESSKISFDERYIYKPIVLDDFNIGKMKSEKELCFNVDREHTNRSERIVKELCNGLTETEFENIKFINKKISENQNNWHQKVFPFSTILMHTYQNRLIKKFFPDAKNILEIGPGSGYLSILLSLEKKNVFTTDIFQPHYIYQNYIYNICTNLNELVENENFVLKDNTINHIPWWKFRKLEGSEFKIDLVVMNHMIVEMEKNSLRKVLNFLTSPKINSPPIFCESLGYQKYNSPKSVFETLEEFNYGINFSSAHLQETAKVYIFKKNLKNKNREKSKFNKNLFNFIPFGKLLYIKLRYILNEIKNYTSKVYNYRKKKSLNNFKIFKEKQLITFEDLTSYYKENSYNFLSPDEEFNNKLKPNRK